MQPWRPAVVRERIQVVRDLALTRVAPFSLEYCHPDSAELEHVQRLVELVAQCPFGRAELTTRGHHARAYSHDTVRIDLERRPVDLLSARRSADELRARPFDLPGPRDRARPLGQLLDHRRAAVH